MSNTNQQIYTLISDLQKTSIRIAILQDVIARQLGITINETYILALLFESGPQTSGSLAIQLGVTPAAITGMTDKLISKKYIKREHDQHDRRKVLLSIDTFPQEEIEKITHKYSHGLGSIFSSIDAKDYVTIERFLKSHHALLETILSVKD